MQHAAARGGGCPQMNTASRMESNSERNRINMSAEAYAALREAFPDVRVTPRGALDIKARCALYIQ